MSPRASTAETTSGSGGVGVVDGSFTSMFPEQQGAPRLAVPRFHRAPDSPSSSEALAAAKAAAWAAGVPARSSALLSSSQLDALWAAVREEATPFPPLSVSTARRVDGDDDGSDPLTCRERALSSRSACSFRSKDEESTKKRVAGRRRVLSYESYTRAARRCLSDGGAGPAAAALLSARTFLRLAGRCEASEKGEGDGKGSSGDRGIAEGADDDGVGSVVAVDAESLCDYLGQRAGQLQMHVHLSCFDASCGGGGGGGTRGDDGGFLTEEGAAAFVRATLPQLARSGCGDDFPGKLSLEDHAAIAARKLSFFHGRTRNGGTRGAAAGGGGGGGGDRSRILPIRDVLAGRALAELLELASPPPSSDDGDCGEERAPGGPPGNWFSAASAAAAAAAFGAGAASGVEAAAAAGVDLSTARVDSGRRSQRDEITTAAEAAASGTLGIPARALCELGDGTLSPLFASRLVEERGDARAIVASFPPGASSDEHSDDEEGGCEGEGEGDAMSVDEPARRTPRRRRSDDDGDGARRRRTRPPPTLSATAGLSLPTFLDFLLAWSDRSNPRSISWLWPALVLRGGGGDAAGAGVGSLDPSSRSSCLTRRDVERLFDPVRSMWVERGQYEALRSSDVAAEVFDIVAPDRPGPFEVISKEDLVRVGSPMARTVIGMLCDVGSFWEHDSREAQLAQAALGGGEEREEEEGEEEFSASVEGGLASAA